MKSVGLHISWSGYCRFVADRMGCPAPENFNRNKMQNINREDGGRRILMVYLNIKEMANDRKLGILIHLVQMQPEVPLFGSAQLCEFPCCCFRLRILRRANSGSGFFSLMSDLATAAAAAQAAGTHRRRLPSPRRHPSTLLEPPRQAGCCYAARGAAMATGPPCCKYGDPSLSSGGRAVLRLKQRLQGMPCSQPTHSSDTS